MMILFHKIMTCRNDDTGLTAFEILSTTNCRYPKNKRLNPITGRNSLINQCPRRGSAIADLNRLLKAAKSFIQMIFFINPNVAYFFEVAAGFSLRITQPKECAKHHILVKAATTSIPEYTQGDVYHNCES
jgi:hypothetical protein